MRIIPLLVALIFFIETKASSASANLPIFKHHTFEFSLTPAADYHFITYPNRSPDFKQQSNNLYRPFLGCNFGLAYIYRPIKYVGISTGVNYLEFVNRLGGVNYLINPFTTNTYYALNGYDQWGFVSVPVLLHAYCRIKKTELDFASGPEFSFPIYSIFKYSQPNGFLPPENQTQLYSTTAMRQQSRLGWGVQLTAGIPVKNFFCISVGPEIKFIWVRPLQPGSYYSMLPHQIEYYGGVKICFRLATDFAGKNPK